MACSCAAWDGADSTTLRDRRWHQPEGGGNGTVSIGAFELSARSGVSTAERRQVQRTLLRALRSVVPCRWPALVLQTVARDDSRPSGTPTAAFSGGHPQRLGPAAPVRRRRRFGSVPRLTAAAGAHVRAGCSRGPRAGSGVPASSRAGPACGWTWRVGRRRRWCRAGRRWPVAPPPPVARGGGR